MSRIIIDLREDGTISSLREETIETFTSPSGAERHEPSLTDRDLAWLDEKLGTAYAQYDTHNKSLEAQIETERETAEAEKKAIRDVHAEAMRAKDEEKQSLQTAHDEFVAALQTAREQMEALKRAGEMKDVALIEKDATIQMLSAKIPNVEEKGE